jgi:hypothetical protein
MSEPAREGEGAPMSVERLVERGKAILAWEAAGCSVDRLASLDRRLARRDPRGYRAGEDGGCATRG